MADSNSILPPGLEHLSVPKATKSSRTGLGQDEFLKLMITQIQHQDPLSPMESGEFLSQLAQFGTVNGITELQSSFSTLANSLQSNQALQASTMVGRNVLASGNIAVLDDSGSVNGAVDLSAATGSLMLKVTDSAGQVVRTMNLGTQGAGLIHFNWDGLDNDGEVMPAGNYVINSETVVDKETVAQSIFISAKVESVTLNQDGSGPLLNLNGLGTVGMNQIREIM
ncbi:MAG: flagellar hook assembly protein FlgD [Gammaproteobacteria bacterium]